MDKFITSGDSDLLENIILQLNKDFQLSGNDFQIDQGLSAHELIQLLRSFVKKCLDKNVQGLMNLLYRIDVPESEIRKAFTKIDQLNEKLVYFILSKEFLKVYFRNKS
ncbi:hypothetical protein [Namhaeicola litoreus]|uniref:Uncharacterized protein n=1 Tax=Namhaeicola litoreus TaxID=1052145 RepID=A0ABW3XYQ9_9FLAO